MSDIKHDHDFNEHELVQPTVPQGENLDTSEVVKQEDVNIIDPSLDDLENQVNPDNREEFQHRTKEEALKQYLADGLDRHQTKGHN